MAHGNDLPLTQRATISVTDPFPGKAEQNPFAHTHLPSSFRWFGDHPSCPDPITREMIAGLKEQVGLQGVTTSVHHRNEGEDWTRQDISDMASAIRDMGFAPENCMIESVPWTDAMKTGAKGWEKDCDRLATIIRDLAEFGFHNGTYNLMGVADWTRTDLAHRLPNGALTLAFDRKKLKTWNPFEESLPGWTRISSPEEYEVLKTFWSGVSEQQMFEAAHRCLERIIPVCEQYNFKLSLHPDDPPYKVLDWVPRIVGNLESLKKITGCVDSPYNGLCFCTGSLGVLPSNDLPIMIKALAPKIHFLHLRSLEVREEGNVFIEVPHGEGTTPLREVIKEAVRHNVQAMWRPDHAPSIDGTGLILRPDGTKLPWRPGYDFKGRVEGLKWIMRTLDAVRTELWAEQLRGIPTVVI